MGICCSQGQQHIDLTFSAVIQCDITVVKIGDSNLKMIANKF